MRRVTVVLMVFQENGANVAKRAQQDPPGRLVHRECLGHAVNLESRENTENMESVASRVPKAFQANRFVYKVLN